MLKWSDSDFAEFFGVEVDDHDAPHTYEYEVSRDGLRLRLSILALEHTIFVRVFRDGLPEPVFTVRRDLCSHAHITDGTGFRRCFEAGVTEQPVTTDMGIPPVLERGVRVFLEPQLQVELIQPRYDTTA
ncbi:MAG: hypothetical protein U1F71_00025 [Verrucomicrobiaceae bacterium]